MLTQLPKQECEIYWRENSNINCIIKLLVYKLLEKYILYEYIILFIISVRKVSRILFFSVAARYSPLSLFVLRNGGRGI